MANAKGAPAADPFEDEEDPFDRARKNFIGLKDLEDRHVIVNALSMEKRQSNLSETPKMIDTINADVIVLDGDPDEEAGIEEVPTVIQDMVIFSASAVPQLRSKVGKDRPTIGQVIRRKAQNKNHNDTFLLDGEAEGLEKLTAPGGVARKEWAKYLKSRPSPFDEE